jgi:hypothetical protein
MRKTLAALAVATVCASPLLSSADSLYRAGPQAFSPPSADDPRTWNFSDMRVASIDSVPGPVSADDPRTWSQASLRPDSFTVSSFDSIRMPNPTSAMSADDPRTFNGFHAYDTVVLSSLSDPVVISSPVAALETAPAYVIVEPVASSDMNASDIYLIAPPTAADVLASNTYDLFVIPSEPASADYLVIVPDDSMSSQPGQ